MLFAIDVDGPCATATREWRKRVQEIGDKHPDVVKALRPTKEAVKALREFSVYPETRVIYVTCRVAELQTVTREWLAENGFPSANEAYCCERYRDKYYKAFEIAAPGEPVILIDDQLENMIRAFRALYSTDKETALANYRRLMILGYGHRALPDFGIKIPFPVFPFPSWKDRNNMDAIEKSVVTTKKAG